tara:strand:+ start:11394 stop:12002 length:609 start_codon:yes stop_codon:yes gene_type:complete
MTRGKMNPIKLTLEEEMLSRLDDLVPMVGDSAAAREFGIKVDRHVVARVALLRGLTAMEAAIPAEKPESVPDSVVAPPPPLTLPAIPEESPPSKADTPDSGVSEDVDVGEDGLIVPPEGWHAWSLSEKVPVAHEKVDAHYKSGGWRRYWGHAGEEVIAFYWSPDKSLQDYPSYKQSDHNGQTIKVQSTPYGPGHIVPHGWSE